MLPNEYEFCVSAGIGIRRAVRDLLRRENFETPVVRWMERKSFLRSIFTVRGPATQTRNLELRIDAWLKGLGQTRSTGVR